MAYLRAIGGGSGGNYASGHGTFPASETAFTINTGVKNMKRFVLYLDANVTNTTGRAGFFDWDAGNPGYYSAIWYNSANYFGGGYKAISSSAAAQLYPVCRAVDSANGDITLISSNTNQGFRWIATSEEN